MAFIEPMYALPIPKKSQISINPKDWVAEEKIDGHRLILEVARVDGEQNSVRAWSRYGLARVLPPHLMQSARSLAIGVYDGELHVPGSRSYGVTELTNGPELCYTMFDLLELDGQSLRSCTYKERRINLEAILIYPDLTPNIHLLPAHKVSSMIDVQEILERVWGEDKEGLILKNIHSIYTSGKRPKNTWIKLKQLQPALMTVIGFVPSRGEINYRGSYAMVVLEDEEKNITIVKTRNDVECRKFEMEAPKKEVQEFILGGVSNTREVFLPGGKKTLVTNTDHPAVGRKLWIEFQERTPDGSYRHPRWDRWDSE